MHHVLVLITVTLLGIHSTSLNIVEIHPSKKKTFCSDNTRSQVDRSLLPSFNEENIQLFLKNRDFGWFEILPPKTIDHSIKTTLSTLGTIQGKKKKIQILSILSHSKLLQCTDLLSTQPPNKRRTLMQNKLFFFPAALVSTRPTLWDGY